MTDGTERMIIGLAESGFGQEPFSMEDLMSKGWVYRDPPATFSFDMWDYFLSVIGEGNYRILATSQGPDWKRDQLLISPEGMKRLQDIESVPDTLN